MAISKSELCKYLEVEYKDTLESMTDAICGGMIGLFHGHSELLTYPYSMTHETLLGDFLAKKMSNLVNPKTKNIVTSVFLPISEEPESLYNSWVTLLNSKDGKSIKLEIAYVNTHGDNVTRKEEYIATSKRNDSVKFCS